MPALENLGSGRGSARLERCVRVAEVPGSNPGAPTGESQEAAKLSRLLLNSRNYINVSLYS